MRGCSSAAPAATSFSKLLSSSVAIGRAPNALCSPPETQIGVLRFLGSGGGDFASSPRNLHHLVCLGGNRIRSVANSSTPFSESQDELETIDESQPHVCDQENSSSVRIKIQLRKECQFGEQFFVVGSKPELGLWNPLQAIPMTWSDDHLWTAELDLPIGEPIQFKLLLREVNGELLWQPGKDRIFHTWETNNIISVFEDWESSEAQQVTEVQESHTSKTKTKQLEHSNEKYNDEDETVVIVADDTSHHTKTDMDRVRSERQISSTAEIPGHQVMDENVVSSNVTDDVAISDMGSIASEDVLEKDQVPMSVPDLIPSLTTPTEDLSLNEEQVEVEFHISNIVSDIKAQNPELDPKQEEQVKGQLKLEEATSRMRFNDEHAPTALENLNELAQNNDEDVNGHPDQDLESAFSESQINEGTDLWGDDIKWGHSTLKRFLNNLGFL